jgi:phosphonate degradation associated HDIG domain protein
MPASHVAELEALYADRGARRYGLNAISQLEHALQGAALSVAAGDGDSLVVATLLHDIGHMIHRLGESPAARGVDDRHEILAAKHLAKLFGPDVVEPIRLHVDAKRYLCAAEADYGARLSPDSVRSLALQGGPMSPDEMRAFESHPFWREAVKLRRYDEGAKVPGLEVPGFDAYAARIAATLRPQA